MNRVRLVRALFAGVAAVVSTLASSAGFAAKVGPVEDPVRVVKIGKGQPIVIGGYFVLSGPDIALGLDQQRGVQLAIDDLGGKLIGHPVKFIAEDDQCGAEGGQTAGSKLAANEQIVLVIGPSCSSSARVAVPLLWKAGIPSIGVSASSPVLTAPDRGAAYDGFLRVILNDGWLAPKIAEYARKVMKLEEISTIHDGSVYAQNLVKNVENSFRAMGGKVCGSEAVAPTDVDMRPMLTRLAICKPKWVYMPLTAITAAAHVARQAREIPGLENTLLVGTDSEYTKDFLATASKSAVGFQFATTALEAEAQGSGYRAFREKYKRKFGEEPIQAFHHYGYDAMMMGARAIEAVAVTDKAGNTYVPIKALRDALYATKGFAGLTGQINCDQYGDCGRLVLAIYEYVSGDPNTFELGKNPVRKWPERF